MYVRSSIGFADYSLAFGNCESAWGELGILLSPMREIGFALAILWILSTLKIITLRGLSQLILLAIIVGLLLYILTGG